MKNENFCNKLNEALADENKAPIDYAELKKLAPKEKDKKVIDKISGQEKIHFKKLNVMRKKYCSNN